jgi:Domain of unknown function (DUF222)
MVMVPASEAEALDMLETAMGFLADAEAADMPTQVVADRLVRLERVDALEAVARGRTLVSFDAQEGSVADGHRTTRAWYLQHTRVTRGQAAEHLAVLALAKDHAPLLAGLREAAVTKSVALQLAKWTRAIPGEFRDQAEEILVAAAKAGAGLRALAEICAEIRYRTAPPDPDDSRDGPVDRGLVLHTTFEGAGVIHGDLTPECAAMVQAVLDALSAPEGGADLRSHPERYHDALEEAMRRLLASDLLPRRAGQPVKALVHIGFADLLDMDSGSVLQEQWIACYRARWAGRRASASVSRGDGGAWLDGGAARAVACDAIIVPVVLADIDPGAVEDLIGLCVQYDRVRSHAAGQDGGGQDGAGTGDGAVTPARPDGAAAAQAGPDADAGQAAPAGRAAEVLGLLEHQILATVIRIVSGPGGLASFLRRNLLGKGLNGPSLPLDVGQTDDIPVHLRRLVALRDQHCQFPGGCDQPAAACEPHHVVHRADGGPTSLANLAEFCHWHHHVALHRLGWQLTVHPDGTSRARSPAGKIIRSHSPPAWAG